MKQKNPILAGILGLLFNGFGLMYVSVGQGLFMLGFTFIVGFMTLGIFLPVLFLGSGAWGYLAAKQYNEEQRSAQTKPAPENGA